MTPQALGINGAFMEYLPPPPVPVAVCVIDTGVDVTPDTAPILQSRLTVMGDGQVGDLQLPDGHGTAVASVMGAPRNGTGSVGLWPWVRVVSVRATSSLVGGLATFNWADYGRALEVCRTTPNVKVVNFSLGGQVAGLDYLQFLDAVATARASDISVVAAAGNRPGLPQLPASSDGVISVAAGDSSAGGALCAFSASAPTTLSAPGCAIEVSGRDARVAAWSGTSLASPQVAVLIAALRGYVQGLSRQEAEDIVWVTARPTPDAQSRAVDAAKAFTAAGLGSLVNVSPRGAFAPASLRPPRLRIRVLKRRVIIRARGMPAGTRLVASGRGRWRQSSRSVLDVFRASRDWRLAVRLQAADGTLSAVVKVSIRRFPS